ncbi:hypothetical protein KFF05_00490 [bacterium SCSIO 12827]|nr:hypothetical protein KFF05_00490 [bacterium SCSIO 12827]
MNSVELLLQNLPPWIEIEARHNGGVKVVATPPLPGGMSSKKFYLELRATDQRGASAIEQMEHRQFPEFCLERHINPDNTFCLYYGSDKFLTNVDAANSWWSGLGSFLANQLYAERRAVWPLAAGLSHGSAAKIQLEMEALAEPLGWKDDVLRSMFRGKGWLAEKLPRRSKTGDRILNSRAPCPRGCTLKHKLFRKDPCGFDECYSDCQRQHKPILRRNCPNRTVIESLIFHEYERRKIEAQIIDKLVAEGKECCGTMKICPLRERG